MFVFLVNSGALGHGPRLENRCRKEAVLGTPACRDHTCNTPLVGLSAKHCSRTPEAGKHCSVCVGSSENLSETERNSRLLEVYLLCLGNK